MKKNPSSTFLFLALLIILSSLLYPIIIRQNSFMEGNKGLGFLLMWIPGIAAVLTLLFKRNHLKSIGWRLGKLKFLLLGYFLPIFYILIVYLTSAAFNICKFMPEKFDSNILIMILIGPFINVLAALGEEIGWRGLLLPDMYKRLGFTKSSIAIGTIWAVWHFPLILFTDFYSGQHLLLALTGFTISTIGITFAYNWLWLASGSIWTVTLLHAVNNFYALNIDTMFEPIEENAELIITDWGIGIPLISVLIAFIFWKLRNKLPQQR